MSKYLVILIALLCVFLLNGCGGSAETLEQVQTREDIEISEEILIPDEYMIESDNYFDYQTGMECAAYASAYLLRHYEEEADGKILFEDFPYKAPDGGTMPQGIETLFQERGYEAQFMTNGTVEELKEEISKGAPVIVFIHVEEPYTTTHNTHYVPLVGYDEEYFYFAESLTKYANCKEDTSLPYNRKTEITKFERLWEDIDSYWENPYYVISKEL